MNSRNERTVRRPIVAIALAALGLAMTSSAFAQTCRATSEASIRPLVELYTSEGCDSCPPADRWLASRFAARDDRAVPIAFHVDYWDRLGWVDRFASPAYTARQYASMRANGALFVYTPQVLVQGHDARGFGEGTDAALAKAARMPAQATITLEVDVASRPLKVDAAATIANAAIRGDARLHIAYVDSGLHSDVGAGENAGVRLAHEHVVRSLQSFGPADVHGAIAARAQVTPPREAGVAPVLVAFVQRASNGDVLQTLALRLDSCRGS